MPHNCTLDLAAGIYAALFAPTASQVDAFWRVLTHRLSAVWGPPGSGKTHFSSGALLSLLAAHAEVGAPCRILIVAFTNNAIEVLLRKCAQLAARLPPDVVAKLCISSCASTPSPAADGAKAIGGTPGLTELWKEKLSITGATVWRAASCFGPGENKKAPWAAPKFNLILCDEASQLLAADALMAVDLLDPFCGRLVVVGDHLQMPPLLRGGPYPAGVLGRPSPAASLLEAVQTALRCGGPAAQLHADACVLLDNHRMEASLAQFCRKTEGIYPPSFQMCSLGSCTCRGGVIRRVPLLPLPAGTPPWVAWALDARRELVVIRLPGQSDAQEAAAAATLLRTALAAWAPPPALGNPAAPADASAAAFRDSTFVVSPHHRQKATLLAVLHAAATAAAAAASTASAAAAAAPYDAAAAAAAAAASAAAALAAATARVSISTVETVQGKEADLVIVLYGLSDADAVAAEADFLYSQPRLNVALTRARAKAVLLITNAVAAPTATAVAASSTPAADEGRAFIRHAVLHARQRDCYLRLRQAAPAAAAAGMQFEEDDGAESDDDAAGPLPAPVLPPQPPPPLHPVLPPPPAPLHPVLPPPRPDGDSDDDSSSGGAGGAGGAASPAALQGAGSGDDREAEETPADEELQQAMGHSSLEPELIIPETQQPPRGLQRGDALRDGAPRGDAEQRGALQGGAQQDGAAHAGALGAGAAQGGVPLAAVGSSGSDVTVDEGPSGGSGAGAQGTPGAQVQSLSGRSMLDGGDMEHDSPPPPVAPPAAAPRFTSGAGLLAASAEQQRRPLPLSRTHAPPGQLFASPLPAPRPQFGGAAGFAPPSAPHSYRRPEDSPAVALPPPLSEGSKGARKKRCPSCSEMVFAACQTCPACKKKILTKAMQAMRANKKMVKKTLVPDFDAGARDADEPSPPDDSPDSSLPPGFFPARRDGDGDDGGAAGSAMQC
jgi:hypothetical protein